MFLLALYSQLHREDWLQDSFFLSVGSLHTTTTVKKKFGWCLILRGCTASLLTPNTQCFPPGSGTLVQNLARWACPGEFPAKQCQSPAEALSQSPQRCGCAANKGTRASHKRALHSLKQNIKNAAASDSHFHNCKYVSLMTGVQIRPDLLLDSVKTRTTWGLGASHLDAQMWARPVERPPGKCRSMFSFFFPQICASLKSKFQFIINL